MGVEIGFSIEGLTGQLTHGPSGARLKTTPPADNGGDGSSYSPTDLLAASLLSCALTTMALTAGRQGLPWSRASGRVVKEMGGPPRRVSELNMEIDLPASLSADQRSTFEKIAHECPVARSLSPEVAVRVTFRYL